MPEPAAVEYYMTRWQDAPKTTIELLNDHPSAVYAMLQFFYSCDYIADHGSSSNLPRLPPPVLHAEVYTLAEKYAIKTLSTLAKSNFGESLKEVEDSDLTQTVSKLYGADGDPHPLRADLLEAMKGRATELFALESEYIEFRKVAWSLPAFLGDVVQAITGPPSAKSTERSLLSSVTAMQANTSPPARVVQPQPSRRKTPLPPPSRLHRLRGFFHCN